MRLNPRQRGSHEGQRPQGDEAMGQSAMAETALQRHRDEPEQPPDLGRGMVDVREEAGDHDQQPADQIRLVAKQRRPAQIQDGRKGGMRTERQRITPNAGQSTP